MSGDQTVQSESNMQLFCEGTGGPTPSITWMRVLEDGSSSEVMHHGPTWLVTNINRTASGTYRCTAYNGFGNSVSHKFNVNVTCKYVCTLISMYTVQNVRNCLEIHYSNKFVFVPHARKIL